MKFNSLWSMAFMTALAANVCLLSVAQAQNARQIAQKTFPSIVLLVMEDINGYPVSLGSGFFIREDVVATNLHVIEGASKGYAKIVNQKTKYDIAGLVGIDTHRDLALLKIIGAKAPILSLGDSGQVAVGDEVYAVGNPQGLEGTFSQGIVSSIRQVGTDSLLQITAPISPGSSGGPVLNIQGEVIGVAVATFKGGQNLNFAIPSSYLSSILKDLKPVTPLTNTSKQKDGKSILDDLGGKNTEGVVGGQMTWNLYSQMGDYSFSLRNNLRETVKDIYCLVIFYDRSGNPLDIDVVQFSGLIPAGLAKRITSRVEGSTEKLNTPSNTSPPRAPQSRVEFRILDFRIVE